MALFPATGGGDNITVGVEQKIGTYTVNGTTYTKYRKIIQGTVNFPTGATTATIAHGITGLNRIISAGACLKRSDGLYFPVPFVSAGGINVSVGMYIDSTVVTFTSPDRNHNGDDALITIEYY